MLATEKSSPLADLLNTLAKANDDIKTADTKTADDGVHCARVQSKRLAAALRLYKGIIPKQQYALEKNHLKRASKMLARTRDDDVIRSQIRSASKNLDPSDHAKIEEWLQNCFANDDGDEIRPSLRRAKDNLSYVLRKWPDAENISPAALFARGTESTFRKAKKAARKVGRTRESSHFHRLRIWTKRLFLQFQLAAAIELPTNKKIGDKLDKLQKQLGQLQDIAITQDFLKEAEKGPRGALKRLGKKLQKERATLEKKTLKRAKKLFRNSRL